MEEGTKGNPVRSFSIAPVALFLGLALSVHAGFEQEVFYQNGLLREDVIAALGDKKVERILKEAEEDFKEEAEKENRSLSLPLPGFGSLTLNRSTHSKEDLPIYWKQAREKLARRLVRLVQLDRKPDRGYNQDRFGPITLRDTMFDLKRLGNGRAVGQFLRHLVVGRYSNLHSNRIRDLEGSLGKEMVEAVFKSASEWAAEEFVRRLAKQASVYLLAGELPEEDFVKRSVRRDLIELEVQEDALQRVRSELLALYVSREADIPFSLREGLGVPQGRFGTPLEPGLIEEALENQDSSGSLFGLGEES